MKTERARELYTDYVEGLLSPALAQALEQHFEAEPDARADYEQFKQVYALLDTPIADEVTVPLGFRAKVLELAAEEHARREAAPSRRAALSITGWFRALGSQKQRRATGGIVAAFAVIALAAVLIRSVSPGVSTSEGTMGPSLVGPVPTTIREVTTQPAAGSSITHIFHIHLPAGIKQASVMAYVVTSIDQITNQAELPLQATAALAQPQELTNDETLQIPVTVLSQAPPGTTLKLLVQWTPDNGRTPGAQVVFTPIQQGTPPSDNSASPVSGNFYNALSALAAEDNVTVIADATATPNVGITPPPAQDNAMQALQAVAQQAGDQVQHLDGDTYQVYAE